MSSIDTPPTYISSVQSMSRNVLSRLLRSFGSLSEDQSDPLRDQPVMVLPRSKFHRRIDNDTVGTLRRALETRNRHQLI